MKMLLYLWQKLRLLMMPPEQRESFLLAELNHYLARRYGQRYLGRAASPRVRCSVAKECVLPVPLRVSPCFPRSEAAAPSGTPPPLSVPEDRANLSLCLTVPDDLYRPRAGGRWNAAPQQNAQRFREL